MFSYCFSHKFQLVAPLFRRTSRNHFCKCDSHSLFISLNVRTNVLKCRMNSPAIICKERSFFKCCIIKEYAFRHSRLKIVIVVERVVSNYCTTFFEVLQVSELIPTCYQMASPDRQGLPCGDCPPAVPADIISPSMRFLMYQVRREIPYTTSQFSFWHHPSNRQGAPFVPSFALKTALPRRRCPALL